MSSTPPLRSTSGAPIVHPTQSNALGARQPIKASVPHVGDGKETAEVCPLSSQSASALGVDAFYSEADRQRLYSASHLKAWLEESGRGRARSNEKPLYRSPTTSRDMQMDAVRLGLPANLQTKPAFETIVHDVTMAIGFSLSAITIGSAIFYESKRREQLNLLEQLPNNPDVLAHMGRAELIKWISMAMAANCLVIMLAVHLGHRLR